MSSILVTGTSGHLGRRVVELLLAAKTGPIIATTRRPEGLADLAARGVDVRRADFDDPASLSAAFAGASRALLVSTDAIGRRGEQQARAVHALAAAGVEQVVYTSMPGPETSSVPIAVEHAGTEAALAATRLDLTILRNNLYTDLLLMALPAAVASGTWYTARGEGRGAFVTREDCARAAAAALRVRFAGRRTLDVTGPAAPSSAEIAAALSGAVGKPVKHVSLPADEIQQGMISHGVPEPMARLLVAFDLAIARGELSSVSDAVPRLTGEAATSVATFLAANRGALGGG